MIDNFFIEVDHYHQAKSKELVCGDVFVSQKVDGGFRTISVLADGLGSGIKASVLATLSANMALKFISNNIDIKRASNLIMETLPVCQVRKIGYSTFTIVDVDIKGNANIIEYDNPSFLLVRNQRIFPVEKTALEMGMSGTRKVIVYHSSFQIMAGDRIVVFTDGVTQAGMGQKEYPIGLGLDAVKEFLTKSVTNYPSISARDLAHDVVKFASRADGANACDDTSCGVIYIRNPRKTLIVTGAPQSRDKDSDLVETSKNFDGHKIICGGTTAQIISRGLGVPIKIDSDDLSHDLPPCAIMEGFDLVTEGVITLSYVADLLEDDLEENPKENNAAYRLIEYLMNSDIIYFQVGSAINQAHQNPKTMKELDLRRNIIKRICSILEKKYLKETHVNYL